VPASRDALVQGFRAPPSVAKPRVWWHWMNGNVTKDGIRKDLEWMKRVGIGGVDAIDASISTPQVVDKRLVYMTPDWKAAFLYAVTTADKFGLEFSINSSPGWSETGGPWVAPQQAMKKAVWSTTIVERPFHGVLPRPPGNIGPYQNAPFSGDDVPTPKVAALDFYRDAVVLAYRQPVADVQVDAVSSNAGTIDRALLSDGDLTKGPTLTPPGDGHDVWVQLSFKQRTTLQGLTMGLSAPRGVGYAAGIEASDDGEIWRHIADMPRPAPVQRFVMVQQTVSFAPVTARYMRVVIKPAAALPVSYRPHAPSPGFIESPPAAPARSYKLVELVFHTAATVHEAEQKAQFAFPPLDFYAIASPSEFKPGSAVDPDDVIDLTGKMKADGTFDWTPPPGRWIVLRLGYSLTGKENHPATLEATGLEVDKLNAAHVRSYISTYLDSYAAVTGSKLIGRRGLNALTIDSSEVGMQNWTENILSEFRRLRGYEPMPWLPVLTGIVVRSTADSDRFLWDFRRTIAEIYARNHFGVIAAVAHERGLSNYAESIETNRPGFGDDMEMRQYADYPMGAMWTYGEKYPSVLAYETDLLGAASVAHVYGRNLVAAESLTSQLRPWAESPRDLKPIIDMEFARGVNRVVIHTSVHQPVDKPPGLSLFSYGQFFNRLENWSAEAKPWVDYMARASLLLQQGRFVADIACFYGEEAPAVALWADKRVDVPRGYAFDFVDQDALINQFSVDRGDLVTKSGMRYRVLYLGGSSRFMTLPTLARIADLVSQGAVLVGKRPTASPSLADDNAKFQTLADALFGSGDDHAYGKGRVFASGSLAAAFAALGVAADVETAQSDVLWLHRQLKGGDLYFLSNRSDQPVALAATFRVAGKAPQIWDAVSGKVAPAAYRIAGGRTQVAVNLDSYGSAFVIFRGAAKAPSISLRPAKERVVRPLNGAWTITFQPGRGAPAKITQAKLASWSASGNPGMKYFSGAGTYTTSFTLPKQRRGTKLVLDLGDLRELAEVRLNNRPLGTLWTPPFKLDISKAVRAGRNVLSVKVVNLWVNRLIGDAQPDAKEKYTFTIIPTYRPDAPLRESGLLGPVTIRRVN
jgi:hypothetical protein